MMQIPKIDLTGRHLLTLHDLSNAEMQSLIDLAAKLKQERRSGLRDSRLTGRNVAIVFEKSSTRTRCAIAVALSDEGGQSEYLSSQDIHLGYKESVPDTARVLGRMFDGIMYRGYAQSTVEQLAEFSGIPVWNALTDDWHPTQALADLLTVQETFGSLKGLRLAYVGDGRNNVANSLMLGCVKAGVHFINCTPEELNPANELVETARAIADQTGSSVTITSDPTEGVRGANVVYTDVWVSMGEEDEKEARLKLLRPYQVNMDLMRATGNLDDNRVIFLHCLPAFHDTHTKVTAESGALEVTNDVFEAPFSRVFDEAENRMHTIKALLIAYLTGA